MTPRPAGTPTLDRAWVRTWADRYFEQMGEAESYLLGEVGPSAEPRGYYEPDGLAAVARWKTPRSRERIAANYRPHPDWRRVQRASMRSTSMTRPSASVKRNRPTTTTARPS